MALPDFKNIKFAFVQIVDGIPSINYAMSLRKFLINKPDGFYYCFLIPDEHFSGVDHSDLRNLVSIEKNQMWDEDNRNTLLGFNSYTNEFIINMNAYYGLKDTDLKTDGKLPHSGQSALSVASLSETKTADSIITLNQTDGKSLYLSMKPIEVDNTSSVTKVYPSLCIDEEKKSIKDAPLLVKSDTLWAKSPTDGTPIMANNCVKPLLTKNGDLVTLSKENKRYGYIKNTGGTTNAYYLKSNRFGKELVYFNTISDTSIAPLLSCDKSVKIINKTSAISVEYTETPLLADILSAGESLTFQITPKDKYVWSYQAESLFNEDYPNVVVYDSNPRLSSINSISGGFGPFKLTEFADQNVIGYEYNLISCDTRKPFLFNSTDRVYGVGDETYIDAKTLFNNLLDGYIALALCRLKSSSSNLSIIRWKKGDPVKTKTATSTTFLPSYITVEGTTKFGDAIYGASGTASAKLDAEVIQLSDVTGATGFTDLSDSDKLMKCEYFSCITIVRV